MDAVKILESLLSKNALGSKTGGGILESLIGGASSGRSPAGGGGAADILGTLLGGKKRSGKGGLAALTAILAVVASSRRGGGGTGSTGSGSDGLGSLLSELAGAGSGKGKSGGGLGDLVGGLLGPGSGTKGVGGGLGDLVGGLLGGGAGSKAGAGDALGGLLGSLLGGGAAGGRLGLASIGEVPGADVDEADREARLIVEAMCLAARSDGRVDDQESEAILGKLGELDEEEAAFVRSCLESATTVQAFADRVPADMADQVYAFSLMAVKLDSPGEAEFFRQLAAALGLGREEVDSIHGSLGQPGIFA